MKTFETSIALVIGGYVRGRNFDSIEEVEEYLTDLVQEYGEDFFENTPVRLLTVLEDLNLYGLFGNYDNDFEIKIKSEDPYIGEEYIGSELEVEYRVEDTNRTFNDLEELQDYLAGLIKDGDYTADEVRNFDITYTNTVEVSFEDVNEGDPEVKVELSGEAQNKYDHFICKDFVLAKEVVSPAEVDRLVQEHLNDADLVNVKRNTSEMTFFEIDYELATLQDRMMELLAEKKHRQGKGEEKKVMQALTYKTDVSPTTEE